MQDLTAYARELGANAREASRQLRGLPRAKRDAALKAVYDAQAASRWTATWRTAHWCTPTRRCPSWPN